MSLMIKENGVTFKELEKNIFLWVCQNRQQFTQEFLERYNQMLMKERDKSKYRHKGLRQTTVKTVCGEVTYRRAIYQVVEEADGGYVRIQGEDRKRSKQGKAEIKVGVAYDGWKKAGTDRYELSDKVVVDGFAKAKDFHEYRETTIAEKYNLDEVEQRILNADGASWIKKVKDKSTCFQLDPFHRNKAAKEKLHHKKAIQDVMEMLASEEVDELFEYLKIYGDSLSDETEIKDVEELLKYYENDREGLISYQSQGLDLPEHPDGLEYRNMEQWKATSGV